MSAQKVLLVRHGETEWSISGQHTGRTDIPLTDSGRKVAKLLKSILSKQTFALVLSSPKSIVVALLFPISDASDAANVFGWRNSSFSFSRPNTRPASLMAKNGMNAKDITRLRPRISALGIEETLAVITSPRNSPLAVCSTAEKDGRE